MLRVLITDPRQTCFAASDVTPVYGVTPALFYPIRSQYLRNLQHWISFATRQVWFMGNKTRSIAFGLVLQQFVSRFTVPFSSPVFKARVFGTRKWAIIAYDDVLAIKKSPAWSRVKIIKRRWIMRNYCFTLFPCFCFWVFDHGLHFKKLFQFCGSVLYFFCTCFRFGMFISVLGFVLLFSGSVFLFRVCHILFFALTAP